MSHDRCVSLLPVSKLKCTVSEVERYAESEKRMRNGVKVISIYESGILKLEESVCDFASAGTVSLAHVAEAARSQSDDEA
jgi:hypothetical protein